MRNSKTPGPGSSVSGAVLTQQEGTPGWSRRRFLTATAVAGTGVLLGPEFAGAARSSANPLPPERGCSDRRPATRADADTSEPRGRPQQSWLVQHLGQRRWRMVDRPASADDGHAVVHRPRRRNRRRDPQLAGGRPTGIQRRLHRDDGEPARRHLLERRRAVHRRRRGLHRPNPDGHAGDGPGVAQFSTQVASVEAVDDQTVHFMLQAPNSRFHSIFSVRWNGAWIMPEHIFSGVEDVIDVRLRQSGRPRALCAPRLRPQRHLVHLGEARGLGPHVGRRLRRAGAAVRHLPQQHGDRQSADRDAQRRPRHDPRPLSGGHVLDRRGGGHRQWLVPGLPVRPSRSDAADVHLQPPEREVPGQAACAGRWR